MMRPLLVLPAVLITLAAVFLGVTLGLLPAVSQVDYLNVEGDAPGVDDGDLAILTAPDAGSLSPGDIVAVTLPDHGRQLLIVAGRQDGGVLLEAPGLPLVLAGASRIEHRLDSRLIGFGDAYAFIDSPGGWGSVAAAGIVAWALAAAAWLLPARRAARVAPAPAPAMAHEAREVAPPPASAPPVASPQPARPVSAPPPTAEPTPPAPPHDAHSDSDTLLDRARRFSERRPLPDAEAPAAPAPFRLPSSASPTLDDDLLRLAREVGQQAPQAGLRHTRRPASRGRRTMGWAGLAATAAAVAAATYLVASERQQKRVVPPPPARRRWVL